MNNNCTRQGNPAGFLPEKIILASASPRRRELLWQIGLAFQVMPGEGEERAKSSHPSEMAAELSRAKAEEVFQKLSGKERQGCLVIGADTVVSCKGRIMGKPAGRQQAEEMLTLLQGGTHQVYTGVTLVYQREGKEPEQTVFCEKTDVTMYPMSREEIRAYVDTGEPMDKAGAYGIQGKCAAFIKEISGDYNNVVGLPVGRLYQEIKKISQGLWGQGQQQGDGEP